VYGKIFDNIILSRYGDKLMSCDYQFGFKSKSSTNLCSMALKETITYYAQQQSPVFCTFLDATKAFDRINYCKLFTLLIERNLPACLIRVLVSLYTHNLVRVSWCGVMPEYILAVSGVKQGAVLSPVLFCVYIDDLLLLLVKTGFGCHVGHLCAAALAYADDLALLAPTATAMRRLLLICEEYAHEFCISFNVSKTKCLIVLPSQRRGLAGYLEDCIFFIDNQPIERVSSFSHLGHLITSEMSDDGDIIKRCYDFTGQVNNTICYFRKQNSFVLV
jgi:hypothetical protein